jgi:hypothetical protein
MLDTKDYQLMAAIIDIASRKGLFAAAELTTIGQLHQKLVTEIQTANSVDSSHNTTKITQ